MAVKKYNMSIDQQIYNTAIEQGFRPAAAKLIAAQARFESADYSSNVFKKNNNTSGIKFIGQPNAIRGTLAPANERTCNGGCNGDYYAKFNTIQDSINDKIVRLYNIKMRGVTPEQLKNAKDATEFANLLKQRGYYGSSATDYASGLKSKLLRINIVEFVQNNKTSLILGLILLGAGLWYYKKIKNK
jgi:LPXTG-motif cell wall-anchored protein